MNPSVSPMLPSTMSRYGSGSYGSGYGSGYSGYGSGYGSSSYGSGYGSGYGTYGSGYGSSYGSSYGSPYSRYGSGYGSSYSGYGSSYGSGYGSGYGSSYGYPNRFGPNQQGMQGLVNTGQNTVQNLGQLVEGFARFSGLLNANFDAVHGSFASVLRLMDVAGEFIAVVKTFALVRVFYGGLSNVGKLVRWILFGTDARKLTQGKGTTTSVLDLSDFANHQQNEQKRRRLFPFVLVMLGLSIIGAPLMLVKLFKKLKEQVDLLEPLEQPPMEGGPMMQNGWPNPNNPESLQHIESLDRKSVV